MEPAVYAMLGFQALGIIFYFYRADSFIKDIIVAPLYFIVPAGVGLFILSIIGLEKIIKAGAARLQVVLLSAFLGIAIITLGFSELTKDGQHELDIIVMILYAISAIGYIMANPLFKYDEHAKGLFKSLVLIMPVWLISYYFYYWHFSPYPLRDIFMETHFMKGAEEFARYGFINFATGNTYIPVLQIGWGLLRRFYAFDILHGQWILPGYLSFFTLLCTYSFLKSFVKDRFTLILSMIGMAAFQNYCFSNSNNTYLTGLTLLFFSLLVNLNGNAQKSNVRVAMELFVMAVLSVVLYKFRMIQSYTFIGSIWPYLISYIVVAIIFIRLGFDNLTSCVIITLALFIAPQFHRAASLYMPLMLMLYGIYHLLNKTQWADKPENKQSLIKKIIIYSVILMPVAIALSMFIIKYWPNSYTYLVKLVDVVGMAMVSEHFTSYEGLNAAMADWLRHTPPAMHVLFVALIGYIFVRHRGRLPEAEAGLILFSIISLAVMMILFLSPLPRVHRLLPFPSIMFIVAFSIFLKFYLADITDNNGWFSKLYAPIILILFNAAMFYLYRQPWKPEDVSDYVLALSPLTEILIAVMIGGVALLIFIRKKTMASVLLVVALLSGVLVDKYQFISKLYIKAYGMRLDNKGAISHYTRIELDAAEKLAKMDTGLKAVLFSDPFTLGIFEARTGINGYYTFENLGQFMLPVYVKDIRATLREAFPQDKAGKAFDPWKAGRIIERLDDFARRHKGAMPEARYALHRLTGLPKDHGAGGDELGWGHDDFMSNIIWILNEKTVMWAWSDEDVSRFPNGDVGYYPMNGAFSDEYLKSSVFPYFEVLLNSGNKVLVLRLK